MSGQDDGRIRTIERRVRAVNRHNRYGGISRDGLRSRVGTTVGGGGRYRVGVGGAHLDGGGVGAGAPLVGGGVALSGQGDRITGAVDGGSGGVDADSRYVEVLADGDAGRGENNNCLNSE